MKNMVEEEFGRKCKLLNFLNIKSYKPGISHGLRKKKGSEIKYFGDPLDINNAYKNIDMLK